MAVVFVSHTVFRLFDLCGVASLPGFGDLSSVFGMVWRFLPLADSSVDMVVSRDLDGRLTDREAAAVQEWLQVAGFRSQICQILSSLSFEWTEFFCIEWYKSNQKVVRYY